jgi:hypothetical protein
MLAAQAKPAAAINFIHTRWLIASLLIFWALKTEFLARYAAL